MATQVLPQGEGAVMLLVPRGVDESDRALTDPPSEFGDCVLVLFEFGPVALLELHPFGRLVAEPTAKLRAGGDILQPHVHGGSLLAQTARPESFYQDSQSISARGLLVSPF